MPKPNYREAIVLDAPAPSGEERRVPRPARYVSWMRRAATQEQRLDEIDDAAREAKAQ